VRNRPLPILILAVLQIFVEPGFNLFMNSWLSGISVAEYLAWFSSRHDWWSLAYLFVLPPIMGIAVYSMKRWSYPLFLLGATWMLVENINYFKAEQSHLIPLSAVLYLGNIAFVAYFLIPAVRAPYLNRKLRWWESQIRFLVSYPGKLRATVDDESIQCEVKDLSKGGAFVRCAREFSTGSTITLSFVTDAAELISSEARVVHTRRVSGEVAGFGVQFQSLPAPHRQQLKKTLKRLRARPIPEVSKRPAVSTPDVQERAA
jgi:hypothetical protein